MLYAFAYPVGDYLHLSVLVQVHFQICNSSALGSKRICKKTRKKKLFCFQLISLPISENKKNKAIQKGVSSQPAISNAIILINTEEKKPYTVYLVQNIITGNHSAWSCAQEFYIHISSFNWGLIILALAHTFCLSFLFQILPLGLRWVKDFFLSLFSSMWPAKDITKGKTSSL